MNFTLSTWIHPKYLTKAFIRDSIESLGRCSLVKVLVFDNFLNEKIATRLRQSLVNPETPRSFSFNESTEMERHKEFWYNSEYSPDNINHFFYEGELFELLDCFLNSEEFLRYISLFYGECISYQTPKMNHRGWKYGITLQDNTFIEIKWWHTDSETWYGKQKRWNILLYLTPEWKEHFWWCLELWKYEGSHIITYDSIAPIFNRLVLLLSEEDISWHKIWNFHTNYHRITYVNQILSQPS